MVGVIGSLGSWLGTSLITGAFEGTECCSEAWSHEASGACWGYSEIYRARRRYKTAEGRGKMDGYRQIKS